MARKRVGWSWVGHLHLSKVHGERSEDLDLGGAAGLKARKGQGGQGQGHRQESREFTRDATVHVLRPRRELRGSCARALRPILRFAELIMGTIRRTARPKHPKAGQEGCCKGCCCERGNR